MLTYGSPWFCHLTFFLAALSSSFACSVFDQEVGCYHDGQCFEKRQCLQTKCKANKNGTPDKFFWNQFGVPNTYYTSVVSCIANTISVIAQSMGCRYSFPIPTFNWSIKAECFSMDIFGPKTTFQCKFQAGQLVLRPNKSCMPVLRHFTMTCRMTPTPLSKGNWKTLPSLLNHGKGP